MKLAQKICYPGKSFGQKCQLHLNARHETRDLEGINKGYPILLPEVFGERKSADPAVSNATGAEQAWIRNRGQAILIRKIRVLNLADILHVRKLSMMLFCALNRTTRLEQFQLADPSLQSIK